MKLGKYDITAKNIWAYIQGNTRKIMEEHGPDIFKSPRFIQEQVIWREVIHNPECYKLGECIHCHCKVPDKLYSDKECEGGCYPAIMDESTWGKFNQICSRRRIDIYNDKFDWDVILADIGNLDNNYFSSLIGPDKATVNFGKVKLGTKLTGSFELFNPDIQPLVINTLMPSCPCLVAIKPEPIETNDYGSINFTVDTEGKTFRQHELWLTIRYNDINRINLRVQFEII